MLLLYQKRLFLSKQEFRKKSKKILYKKSKYYNFAKFYQKIDKILQIYSCKKVLIYLPLAYEIDLLRFRRKLSFKYEIFTPFMQGASLKMVKLRLPFTKKKFKVLECMNSSAAVKIDAAIIPVIGADKNLKRIGHGMGFYDRFFSTLSYSPLMIFVCLSDNFSQKFLGEAHDISANFFLNPYKNYMKRVKNDRAIYRRCRSCGPFIRLYSS